MLWTLVCLDSKKMRLIDPIRYIMHRTLEQRFSEWAVGLLRGAPDGDVGETLDMKRTSLRVA